MALGKNLKKKKLIPDKEEKKDMVKAQPKVKKKRLISKAKQIPKKPAVPRKKAKEELINFISKEKEERRELLLKKFETEIKELAGKSIQFVVFKMGAEEYAIEIAKVKEVVVTPKVSLVPKMPEYIKGLSDIRGRTVLVLDLALKLGLPSLAEAGYTLVIDSKKQRMGLLLSNLPLALKVDGKDISPPMNYLNENAKEDTPVKGVIKLNERLIYYLDVDELLSGEKAIVVPNRMTK